MSRGSVTFEEVKVKSPTIEGIDASSKQGWVPVFKLMHLDGTGGSMETIIHNPIDIKKAQKDHWMLLGPRMLKIGEVNKEERVIDRIVTEPWYQGSYNYAETAQVGLPAHRKFDVEPDDLHPGAAFNPPNRHRLLALRKFPKL